MGWPTAPSTWPGPPPSATARCSSPAKCSPILAPSATPARPTAIGPAPDTRTARRCPWTAAGCARCPPRCTTARCTPTWRSSGGRATPSPPAISPTGWTPPSIIPAWISSSGTIPASPLRSWPIARAGPGASSPSSSTVATPTASGWRPSGTPRAPPPGPRYMSRTRPSPGAPPR